MIGGGCWRRHHRQPLDARGARGRQDAGQKEAGCLASIPPPPPSEMKQKRNDAAVSAAMLTPYRAACRPMGTKTEGGPPRSLYRAARGRGGQPSHAFIAREIYCMRCSGMDNSSSMLHSRYIPTSYRVKKPRSAHTNYGHRADSRCRQDSGASLGRVR